MLQSMGSQRAGHDLRLNSNSNAFIFSSKNLTEDQTQDFLGPSVVVKRRGESSRKLDPRF